MDELTHLIDGEPVATDQWFHTVNPETHLGKLGSQPVRRPTSGRRE
jgi:hypothetical protein